MSRQPPGALLQVGLEQLHRGRCAGGCAPLVAAEPPGSAQAAVVRSTKVVEQNAVPPGSGCPSWRCTTRTSWRARATASATVRLACPTSNRRSHRGRSTPPMSWGSRSDSRAMRKRRSTSEHGASRDARIPPRQPGRALLRLRLRRAVRPQDHGSTAAVSRRAVSSPQAPSRCAARAASRPSSHRRRSASAVSAAAAAPAPQPLPCPPSGALRRRAFAAAGLAARRRHAGRRPSRRPERPEAPVPAPPLAGPGSPLLLARARPRWARLQRQFQDALDVVDQLEVDLPSDGLRHLLQVLLRYGRQYPPVCTPARCAAMTCRGSRHGQDAGRAG